jgi:hypothetical protein
MAAAPFRTLELAATASVDDAALTRLGLRAAAARGVHPESMRVYAADHAGDGGGGSRWTWRVWWAPPSRWRDELTWPGRGTEVSVVRDDAALTFLPAQRMLYTTEPVAPDRGWELVPPPVGIMELPTIANRSAVFPLIHPPLPEAEWAFTTLVQQDEYHGRPTRRVRATRRDDALLRDAPGTSGYWPGVDEYECQVDDALGILLRLTGIAEGASVATIGVDEVRVDAPFPPDIFDFVPPRGTRIARIARRT